MAKKDAKKEEIKAKETQVKEETKAEETKVEIQETAESEKPEQIRIEIGKGEHGFSFEFDIIENNEVKETIEVAVYAEDEAEALEKAVEGLKDKNFRYTQKFKKF